MRAILWTLGALFAVGAALGVGCADSASDCELIGECSGGAGGGTGGQGGSGATGGTGGEGGTGGVGGAGGMGGMGGGPSVCAFKRFGDQADQSAQAIGIDSAKNVAIAGAFTGSFPLGAGNLSSANGPTFVAFFDQDLAPLRAGAFPLTYGAGALVPDSGDMVVVGAYTGTPNFGCGDVLAGDFVVLQVQQSDAKCASSYVFNAPLVRASVAVANSGAVAVAGSSTSNDNFGISSTNKGMRDIIVAILDSTGAVVSAPARGSAGDDEARDVAFDSSGNIIVVGSFQGSIDLGNGGDPLPHNGGDDIFAMKLGSDGHVIWGTSFGGSGDERATHVAVLSGDKILVAGELSETVNFGEKPATVQAGGLFLAELNASDGTAVWAQGIDATGSATIADLTTGAGGFAITGSFQGTINLGDGEASSVGGSEDIFVAKYKSDHTFESKLLLGDSSDDQRGAAVALDGSSTFFAGYFAGSLEYGDAMQAMSNGGRDIFVAEYCP